VVVDVYPVFSTNDVSISTVEKAVGRTLAMLNALRCLPVVVPALRSSSIGDIRPAVYRAEPS
jgi:hypothetical protein